MVTMERASRPYGRLSTNTFLSHRRGTARHRCRASTAVKTARNGISHSDSSRVSHTADSARP